MTLAMDYDDVLTSHALHIMRLGLGKGQRDDDG
jgi:hypothetical protein